MLLMIVTPLAHLTMLFWMISGCGIIGAMLRDILNDPSLSLRETPTLTWIAFLAYGAWAKASFSFNVFYAGLQRVSTNTLESSIIDCRSCWGRICFNVIPNLMPLATFVTLVELMINFRVIELIRSFGIEANATSLPRASLTTCGARWTSSSAQPRLPRF